MQKTTLWTGGCSELRAEMQLPQDYFWEIYYADKIKQAHLPIVLGRDHQYNLFHFKSINLWK